MSQINQIFFIENVYASKDSIKKVFDQESYEFLIEKQYLQCNSSNQLAFKYVGVISFGDKVVCVLPKYFRRLELDEVDLIRKFKIILRVLRKAGRSSSLPDSKYLKNSSEKASEIALADLILRDYIEYGVYEKTKEEVILNADGETNWDKTVSAVHPLISKGGLIYHDTFNFSNTSEERNQLTELHKWALKYCYAKYGNILDYNLAIPSSTYDSLKQFGGIENIKRVLDKGLRETYIDREIRLLKNLSRLITKDESESVGEFNLFGTGYFHVIWELLCSESFTNFRERYTNLIPKPKWYDLDEQEEEKDTIEPDILVLSPSGLRFFVLDAKYYSIEIQGTPLKVTGNPGVGDITKQILYEKAFSSLDIDKKHNILLYPSMMTTFYEIKGYVEFDLLPGHRVYNVFINPEQLCIDYLQNERQGLNVLDQIGDSIDLIN